MIKLEEIWKLIQEQKELCKPDTDKEYQLNQLIQEAMSQYALAIDEGNDEEAKKLHGKIKKLKEELAQVEDLNAAKESGAFAATLKTNGKLPKLCKEFETEVLKKVEPMIAEEAELSTKVTEAKDTLIEVIKAMREKRQEIADLLSQLDSIKQYTPDPCPSTNGSTYEYFKSKMTQFNFVAIADQIKRVSGVFY